MKLKIVNKKKFIISITIVLSILYFAISTLFNTVSSNEITSYKTITVSDGDTLWSIAQAEQVENEYYKNTDIRKIIYDIKEINNLKSSNLNISQNLKIPVK